MKYLIIVLVISCTTRVHSVEDDAGHKDHSICDKKVDVGFVIDSSGSLQYHWERVLDLVELVHDKLATSIGDLRVGVMTFSNRVIYYRRLKFYYRRYFKVFLNRMKFQGKITRLDKALDYVLKEFFLVKEGHRPGAIKVAILFTDGRQTLKGIEGGVGDLSKTVKHIREDGTHLIIIGVVNVNKDLLETLDAGLNQLLYAGTLQQDRDGVIEQIPHRCQKTVCQIQYEPQFPDCIRHTDILFVVDSSGSLRGYFEAEKYFVNSIAGQFDISQKNSHVAFVRFSHIVKTEIHFKDYTDMHDFHDAVDKVFYDGGLTRIDLGLENAELEFTDPSYKERLNDNSIKKILVLLTDGRQLDTDPNPAVIAKRLRKMGVDIVVLGVGKTIDANQMQEIAGPGVKWYEHTTFDELINHHNIDKIKGVTCDGHVPVHHDEDEDHDE